MNAESSPPSGWTIRSLRPCLRAAPGYGINAAAVSFDDGLPAYLRITDISDNNRFRPSPRVLIEHPKTTAFFLQESDIVFARTGASVGKSYLYDPKDGPLVFVGLLIQVCLNPEDVQQAFLSYCVQSGRYWDWGATMLSRSCQPGISRQEYETFQLFLSPSDEQREIATVLSDMAAEITILEQRRNKTRTLKQSMMQQLLTGLVRLVKPDRDREVTRC